MFNVDEGNRSNAATPGVPVLASPLESTSPQHSPRRSCSSDFLQLCYFQGSFVYFPQLLLPPRLSGSVWAAYFSRDYNSD